MKPVQVDGVLDMTFLDIREESDFQNGLALRMPGTLTPTSSPSKKKKNEIRAIRLANNYFTTVDIISGGLSNRIDMDKVLWLDLSFNQITSIIDDFAKLFPNLTTLNLHANKIFKLQDIKKIGSVENLKSLSLYGNPVEEHKHYRNYVLHSCSKLTQFDSSPVTKSEIQRVSLVSLFLLLIILFFKI
jgi:hypothetical protein